MDNLVLGVSAVVRIISKEKMETLSRDDLMNLLEYDANSGVFRWKRGGCGKAIAGAIAGGLDRDGYRLIGIDNKAYAAHRLAWLYSYGVWPNGMLDHINLNKDDNRLENLREVGFPLNSHNRKPYGRSRFKGVSLHECGKWRASITINKRQTHLGLFHDEEQAAEAYRKAAEAYYGESARGGINFPQSTQRSFQ